VPGFLLCPEVRRNRKGGRNGHKVSVRSNNRKLHRTYHHNFRSAAVNRRLNRSNGGVDRPTALCDRTEESVSKAMTVVRLNGGVGRQPSQISKVSRASAIANDRTEASVGNQGLQTIERRRRSARHRDRTEEPVGNRGRFENAFSAAATDRTDASIGSSAATRSNRGKLGGCTFHGDQSGRFDGG
jgi:hypothetical protein